MEKVEPETLSLNQELSPTKTTPNICKTSDDLNSPDTENNSEMTALILSNVQSESSIRICKPIHLIEDENVSLHGVIKLNETENAWKPTHLVEDDKISIEDRDTLDLFKRVRGILNKLTPEKFVSLVGELKTLTIDTHQKMDGVIQLIYEKACDEPNDVVGYIGICKLLSSKQQTKPANYFPSFRKTLIDYCQREYTKTFDTNNAKNRLIFLQNCEDLDRRAELEEEERKYRRRSTGTVRFIGELFKFEVITSKIIYSCVRNFLDYDNEIKSEESFECVCKLLTTVGSKLEKSIDLTSDLKYMQDIVNSKTHKISSRFRFMLQDVIDLRNNNWISLRSYKTIEQMQGEKYMINLLDDTKDSRNTKSNNDNNNSRGNINDSITGHGEIKNSSQQYSHPKNSKKSSAKIRLKNQQRKEKSTQDYNIRVGSGNNSLMAYVGNNNDSRDENNLPDIHERPQAQNSKKISRKCRYKKKIQERMQKQILSNNISGGSGDNSIANAENQNQSKHQQNTKSTQSTKNIHIDLELIIDDNTQDLGLISQIKWNNQHERTTQKILTLEEITKKNKFNDIKTQNLIINTFAIIEDYVNGLLNIDNCINLLISEIFITNVEHGKNHRATAIDIITKCVKNEIINIDNLLKGLKEHLEIADDNSTDMPRMWEYTCEILAPLIKENIIILNDIVNSFNELIAKKLFDRLLRNLFTILVNENGIEFVRDLWNNSNSNKWIEILSKDEYDEFINNFS